MQNWGYAADHEHSKHDHPWELAEHPSSRLRNVKVWIVQQRSRACSHRQLRLELPRSACCADSCIFRWTTTQTLRSACVLASIEFYCSTRHVMTQRTRKFCARIGKFGNYPFGNLFKRGSISSIFEICRLYCKRRSKFGLATRGNGKVTTSWRTSGFGSVAVFADVS